jgi:hypothetical protein
MRDRATIEYRREQLALLIASGHKIRDAAAQAKTAERNAYTWLAEPSFRARISELRALMVDAAIGRLSDNACRAVDTLVELLEDDAPSIRHRAATSVLEVLGRFQANITIDQRLVQLEMAHAARVLAESKPNGQATHATQGPLEEGPS